MSGVVSSVTSTLSSNNTWLRLTNKVAIVTGAGSGIGAAVSYYLTQQGCHVVLADKNKHLSQDTAQGCLSASSMITKPPQLYPIECDVSCSESVQNLIKESDEFAKRVHQEIVSTELQNDDDSNGLINDMFINRAPLANILINCAGITRDSLITNMNDRDFDDVIKVNLRGSYLTCRYFSQLERLEQLASGNASSSSSSIVNISSIAGLRGNKGQVNYSASKAGIIGMTKSLAKELAKYNTRVNCIVPGFIDTPMSAKMPEKIKQTMKSNIPMKKFGTTDNVSDLILFLSSERSAYITGEAVEISGAISF